MGKNLRGKQSTERYVEARECHLQRLRGWEKGVRRTGGLSPQEVRGNGSRRKEVSIKVAKSHGGLWSRRPPPRLVDCPHLE